MNRQADNVGRTTAAHPALAGLAAWALPGLGHWLIGERGRGLVLFVTVMLTYWTGVCVGGVANTIDPRNNTLWFVAQLGTGPQTVALYAAAGKRAGPAEPVTPWPDAEIAIIYVGVAGLLNMLVVLDAVGRAATGGSPRVAMGPGPPPSDRRSPT